MTLDYLKKMSLNDMREAANKLTDEELDDLREEAAAMYPVEIVTYPEFRETMKDSHYTGKDECFVGGCKQPAYYEGGDARFWCGMCEEHAAIRYRYVFGLVYGEDSIRRKIKFNLGDHQCQNSTK
jgi:hypothetical protein